MNTRKGALGILTLLAAGVGCTHLSLKDKGVRDIRVLVTDAALCPGQETKIAVTATLADGTEAATTGAGHGKVGWDNYAVTFSGGEAKDGRIRLPSDPRATWNRPVALVVEASDHPGVHWSGNVAVRYDCELYAYLAGAHGTSGSTGRSAKDGKSPGGRGDDGGDGSAGEDGHHGQSVESWVTTVTGPAGATLVQAAVRGDGSRMYYAFDPARGTLTIDTSGAPGGDGGNGGGGGDGGKASADVKQGRGGDGGDGECGGNGGDGGDVVLHVDPKARSFVSQILIRNDGGDSGKSGDGGSGGKGSPRGRDGRGARGCSASGGHGGHRETTYEPVAPLW